MQRSATQLLFPGPKRFLNLLRRGGTARTLVCKRCSRIEEIVEVFLEEPGVFLVLRQRKSGKRHFLFHTPRDDRSDNGMRTPEWQSFSHKVICKLSGQQKVGSKFSFESMSIKFQCLDHSSAEGQRIEDGSRGIKYWLLVLL